MLAGRPPWIAVTLALSFSLYGLVRKVISVEALPGLATETLLLLPLAAGYLLWCGLHGSGAFTRSGGAIAALLIGSGLVTAVPLFLFAYAARLLPYSTVGRAAVHRPEPAAAVRACCCSMRISVRRARPGSC